MEILRRNGRYRVRITVEQTPAPVQTHLSNGWVGIDANLTFLALCHSLPNGNPREFNGFGVCVATRATIGNPQLFDGRSNQPNALVVRSRSKRWAKDRGAGLVVEDLRFINDRDFSAKFNRATHEFNYRALLTAVERQATREGVAWRKVKPAYTSMIGRFKYQPQYGISVHQAALVIGRRGGLKVFRENVPKALRQWMQAQARWDDSPYRKTDWSAWNRLKRALTAAVKKPHLDSNVD